MVNEVEVADTLWRRCRGLIGHERKKDFGLIIPGCNMIHTIGMKFPLDVIFLRKWRVVKVVHDVRPNRIGPVCWKADAVVEISAHDIIISIGDLLQLQ